MFSSQSLSVFGDIPLNQKVALRTEGFTYGRRDDQVCVFLERRFRVPPQGGGLFPPERGQLCVPDCDGVRASIYHPKVGGPATLRVKGNPFWPKRVSGKNGLV